MWGREFMVRGQVGPHPGSCFSTSPITHCVIIKPPLKEAVFFFLKVYLFVRGRGRERESSRLQAVSTEPNAELKLMNLKMVV